MVLYLAVGLQGDLGRGICWRDSSGASSLTVARRGRGRKGSARVIRDVSGVLLVGMS